MHQRLPIVLATAALAVALLGATGVAGAAERPIARALFAVNAGAVGHIQASRTPKAGQLLPLGSDAKFPASVLPTTTAAGAAGPAGAQGVKGDQGPKGDAGSPGTARAYAMWDAVKGKLVHASKVTSISQGGYGPGDWCVTLDSSIDASSAVPQAAVEYNLGNTGIAEWSTEAGGCSTHANSVQIWTLTPSGAASPKSFTVIVP
jgi:hypothetical protein